jgi:hypothetical protein
MRMLEIGAQEVRLPERAVEALEQDIPVAVTHYGRRRHVLLSEERFALVAPLLELLEAGASIPSELLLTEGDLELERMLAAAREPDAAEDELVAEALRQTSAG